MQYRKRLLEDKILRLAEYFPAIVLTGARQVGKSTLLKHLQPQAQHITFDPVIDIGNARSDPELFLDQLKLPIILDEIQYAPELLSVVKRRIDEQKLPGQYWITGAQNLSVLKNISESLAGRAAVLSLYPMTIAERYADASAWIPSYIDNPENFLQRPISRISQLCDETLTSILWKGGFPGLIDMDDTLYPDALQAYLRAYVERDVRLLSDINDLQQFASFVQLAANLSAQEIHATHLGREIGISSQTAQRWINLLKSTYQWLEIPPYSGNTLKRISGKKKGFFIDSGMACNLMHISSPQALLGHPKLGAIFETFVVNDIVRQLPLLRGNAAIYHWRSHAGAEVDLLLELDNRYYPIEIKCKTRPSKIDISGIKAFRATYPQLNIAPALVVCAIEQIQALGENCFAIPYDLLIV